MAPLSVHSWVHTCGWLVVAATVTLAMVIYFCNIQRFCYSFGKIGTMRESYIISWHELFSHQIPSVPHPSPSTNFSQEILPHDPCHHHPKEEKKKKN